MHIARFKIPVHSSMLGIGSSINSCSPVTICKRLRSMTMILMILIMMKLMMMKLMMMAIVDFDGIDADDTDNEIDDGYEKNDQYDLPYVL